MKLIKVLNPSGWKMTPKLLMAFLLTAVLPVLAASVFSLTYFYGAAYDNARRNLARELTTARHFMDEAARRLTSDTRLASRENVVALNLSLGLTAPVLDYLATLGRERKFALAALLNAEGREIGNNAMSDESGNLPFVTGEHLALARNHGGVGFQTTLANGQVLLVAVVPVTVDPGPPTHYLVTAIDPASGAAGGLLDEIRQVASGPVVFGNSHGLLGVAPGSPVWDAATSWPTTYLGSDALVQARSQGATYLFGFEPIGDSDSPSAWVGVSFSLDAFQQVTNAAAGGLVLLAFLAVSLSFAAALAFSRGLTRPLMRMADQAGAWQADQGGNRLDVTTHDETGILGRAFNEVLDRLDVTLESLRRTQSYLKNIFNSLTSVLVSIDETGTVQEWNVAAERFNGVLAADAIGKKVATLSPIFTGLEPSLFLAAATREPQYLKKDLGRGHDQRTFDICLYPLVWNGVSGVVIRLDDITESLKKDRQLRQAQKMETVGTLTEGIAHNFNNLLTGINGTVSLVGLELDDEDPIDRDRLRSRITMIEDSTHKAAEIVRRLMALSRGGTGEFTTVDLTAVVREVAKTSRMVFDNTIEVEINVPSQALVRGDRSQLEQCLLNLVINAAHAMTIMRSRGEHSGGTVRVSIKSVSTPKDFLVSHPEVAQGTYWLLQVQDSGVGISPENQAKIFDPFFTTKDSDKGSGLGLAMVYTSIRQHKGFIDVYSEVGRGTTVSLNIPILEEGGSSNGVLDPRVETVIHRGEGLILVVDDEKVVQTTAQMILQACGYEVVVANNGLEALAVYETQRSQIRAVLLDSSMPKLSGAETLEALKRMNPQVKVVMSSGLFDGSQIDEVAPDSTVRFLPKPYSLADLSQVFHDLLGGPV